MKIGLRAVHLVKERQLKRIGIRIIYQDLVVFQYLMDDKQEDMWLKRKAHTVLESQHSSLYVYEHQKDYQTWLDNDNYAICGGGFPIIEEDKCVGAICITGLKHDEDHALIVEILEWILVKG